MSLKPSQQSLDANRSNSNNIDEQLDQMDYDILKSYFTSLKSQPSRSDYADLDTRIKNLEPHVTNYELKNYSTVNSTSKTPMLQVLINNEKSSFSKQSQSNAASPITHPSVVIESKVSRQSTPQILNRIPTYLNRLRLRITSILVGFSESLAVFSIIIFCLCIFSVFIPSILASLIVALAAIGTSLGLRKMYVKALLKIFEYATNIKDEKLNDCEELLGDVEIKTELEKQKNLSRLKRLRQESFMLNPPSKPRNTSSSRLDEDLLKELDDIDRKNNNYMKKYDENEGFAKQLDASKDAYDLNDMSRPRTLSDIKKDFQLGDIIDFVHQGMETIIDDQVTKRFTTEELTVWNLLSRTNQQYEYVSFRVTVLWMLGFILRYCILFPFRLILFILACFYTFVSTSLIGMVKSERIRKLLNWYGSVMLHRILSRVFSAIITFHNKEYRAAPGSICVANHTSPIDVVILSTDNVYSMIGQKHGGFTGMMQRAFSRASKHIWFDRSESKDRGLVARRMREHILEKTNQPILIFPEGTCINNTSVMMFKKGCFEIDAVIYPVAIKYDLRFGDAFWNSNKHSMLQYLLLMMTSWAIVVDVYYLPPMHKREGESAANFASRVKSEIVKKGSFADLNWDGMLKRTSPKLDLMYEQQQKYVNQLKID